MKTLTLLLGFLLVSFSPAGAEGSWTVVSVDAETSEMVLRDPTGVNRTVRPGAAGDVSRYQVGDVVPGAEAERWAS